MSSVSVWREKQAVESMSHDSADKQGFWRHAAGESRPSSASPVTASAPIEGTLRLQPVKFHYSLKAEGRPPSNGGGGFGQLQAGAGPTAPAGGLMHRAKQEERLFIPGNKNPLHVYLPMPEPAQPASTRQPSYRIVLKGAWLP